MSKDDSKDVMKKIYDVNRLSLKLRADEMASELAESLGVLFIGKDMLALLKRAGEANKADLPKLAEEVATHLSYWPKNDDAIDVMATSTESLIRAKRGLLRLVAFTGPVVEAKKKSSTKNF